MKRKHQKKRTFLYYFSRTLALLLAFTGAVGATALHGKRRICTENAEATCTSAITQLEEWFDHPDHADPSYAEIRRQLALHASSEEYIDSAFVLYDKQTGQTYDSSMLIWSSVRIQADHIKSITKLSEVAPELAAASETDDGRIIINTIDEDEAQMEKLLPFPENRYDYLFQVQDLYYKDGQILPGTISVYCTSRTKIGQTLLGKEKHFKAGLEPEHIPADAIQFTTENTVAIPEDAIRADMLIYIPVGSQSDSPALQEAYRLMAYSHGDHSISPEGEYHLQNLPLTSTDVMFGSYKLPSGKTEDARFELYAVSYYDFYQNYLPALLLYSGMIFLIVLIISALIAKIFHMRYTKAYEINEYRRNLTAALAHDLKSPLTVISGCAQNLRENVHTEKRESYADAILENAAYMDKIIADVLDLAKLEQLQSAEKTEVDLVQLANVTAERYAAQIEEKQLRLTCSGKFSADCNEKMLSQAIGNLILNAVQYTPQGGSITISADEKLLTIQNDSAAISEPEKLCEPLFKGDAARAAHSGSGMGLSIVRQIIQLNGMHFSVKSENGKFTAIIRA